MSEVRLEVYETSASAEAFEDAVSLLKLQRIYYKISSASPVRPKRPAAIVGLAFLTLMNDLNTSSTFTGSRPRPRKKGLNVHRLHTSQTMIYFSIYSLYNPVYYSLL